MVDRNSTASQRGPAAGQSAKLGSQPTALSPAAKAIALLVRGYQLGISPLFPPSCRFYPSCSEYALGAVKIHGALRGSALALARMCKCNPWHTGGFDPVPGSSSAKTDSPLTKDFNGNA
ncbi:membrane protein insertion efficiency factor YidD [Limnobacter sp.]|uniref:membrane protein insertion efficiency factor YidD n=1 Tax=Limnobacter sp. TaxID=2003368 RepID=UPI003514AF2B